MIACWLHSRNSNPALLKWAHDPRRRGGELDRQPLGSDRDTFPKLVRDNAERFASRVAIREKDYGIWQSYTWRDYFDQARLIALGLASLGFARGDKTAIIGDNRPQLYWAVMATRALGGVPVPIYQDSVEKEMQYILDHAEARFAVVEDHRRPERRDALPPEPERDRAERRGVRGPPERRGDPVVPADGVGRRPHLLVCPVHRDGVRHQLPGERRHGPPRLEGDRADLLLRPAEDLGDHPHQRDGPRRGLRLAEAPAGRLLPPARPGDRAGAAQPGARTGLAPAPRSARAPPRRGPAPRQPRDAATPPRLHRGRGDRARDLRLLPRARDQRQADLRHDRGERVHHRPEGRRRAARHGGDPHPRRRAPDFARGRGALPEPRRLPGLLQEPGGDAPDPRGWLGALGRRGCHRTRRPPQDRRPRQGRGPSGRRHALRAEVPREQAQVLAVRQGGRVRRTGPPVRRSAGQHRSRRGRELGGARRDCIYELHGPVTEAGGLRPGPAGGGAGEPEPRRGRGPPGGPDSKVPDPPQGAGSGRRGDHPDAQGATRIHRPEVRGPHRGAVRRGWARGGGGEGDVRGWPDRHDPCRRENP